ncbi:hypothetical protein [Streptomyces sp. NPDC088794]|uniref:hypothetical protein n=1 Tax=Streptomyces sp. NPDC088794 TaxID=3365902 RepID=UPI0037F7EAEF
MSDNIPDAIQQQPWQPSDGPKPAVHVYPHRNLPALDIRINGTWHPARAIARQHWGDGTFVYQVDVAPQPGYTIHRTYRWPQPGLRRAPHRDSPVSPVGEDEPMTTTMQNYGLTWTDPDE